ncbi:hypothetical protein INF27_01625 [Bifidobacterium saeculare]|uniref:hypothetical protein n=1 Tax=Bifidobacterium pullorum TaxID=78448 RepID=UPI001876EEF5|nr:hypothetical protein [Bifidobacterium pullorum]MBE5064734.1 hypothetical protein [Bifidobacterium pullorum subsp. saeculare]
MSDGSHSDIDMDLSFPMPSNKPTADDDVDILQRAADNASRPPKPPIPRSENGDVVDTFWDIPPIEFPTSNSSDEPVDGPRHAASKGMPSTAETQVIDSGNSTAIADSSSDENDDAEATVLIPDASSAAPATPLERSTETSVLSGTRLFPESGPAAQETAIIESVPALDFGSVISGEAPAAIPPAAVAGDGSVEENAYDSENSETSARKRSLKPVAVAITVVILIAAVAVGGVLLWRNRENDAEHSAALSTCTSASETYNTARDALDQALADAKDEQAITSDQVADAATVSSLSDAIDEANGIGEAAACGTSLSSVDLQHNAKTNQDLAQQLTDSVGKVTDAAKAVADSRDAKAEADKANARNSLQTAVNDAQTLLDNSLWAVADNTTRVTLEEAINTANALLQQDDPDLKALQDAQTALQSASDGVNASMEELAAQNATNNNGYYDYGYAGGGGGRVAPGGDNGGDTANSGPVSSSDDTNNAPETPNTSADQNSDGNVPSGTGEALSGNE